MGVKLILALAFVLSVATAANISPNAIASAQVYKNNNADSTAYASQSHNLIVGYRQPGDQLVLQQHVVKSSSWLQITTLERTFSTTRGALITQIQALDQKTNGNGAYAKVVRGGLGYANVTISFKSKRGHGINFVVLVYAR